MGYHAFWLACVLDVWLFLMKIRYPVIDFCTSWGSEGNPARDCSAHSVQKSRGKPPNIPCYQQGEEFPGLKGTDLSGDQVKAQQRAQLSLQRGETKEPFTSRFPK